MYRINHQTNSIQKIEETTFKEIGASERNHLQEWIAKNPEVLCGEDESLLIIQKEFDGFSDTKERLDLLALDHNGNLVIIENKLDDSGRDVTWQGLKYVSYCASLTTEQILSIYDQFLGADESAEENVREFLELDEEAELLLNDGDQRLILIAHKFRKEVTSTVMWLLDKEVQIQCFKAVPYKYGEEALLQLEQIIPLPETKEYVISLQKKEKEEKIKGSANRIQNTLVINFWNAFKDAMMNAKFNHFQNVTATDRTYISFGYGSGRFACAFGRTGYRVEFTFTSDPENAQLEALEDYASDIKALFPFPLIWEKPHNKKYSRVQYTHDYEKFKAEFLKKENRSLKHWRDEQDWMPRIELFKELFVPFFDAVHPYYDKLRNQIT